MKGPKEYFKGKRAAVQQSRVRALGALGALGAVKGGEEETIETKAAQSFDTRPFLFFLFCVVVAAAPAAAAADNIK